MVWVKEETEEDESPKVEVEASTDSAKRRDFNDSEGRRNPGDLRRGNTQLGEEEGEMGHEGLESTEAKVQDVAVEENMDAVAGVVVKGSTVVKGMGVAEGRGVAEEKVKIDGKHIMVKNTLVDVYGTRK